MAIGIESSQYWIINPVAVNSSANVDAHENQYIHPIANPRLGSTNRAAYDANAPGIGKKVATSPSDVITE